MLNSEYLVAFIRNRCCHHAREELKLPRFLVKLFALCLKFYQPITVFVPIKGNYSQKSCLISMDQTAKASEQSQGSEAFAADTTDAVTYFAVKEMPFFNPNEWKELIIVVIITHSIIIFQPSSCGEFSISVLPACISKTSGGSKESSERPRAKLRIGIQSVNEVKKH